MNPKFLITLFCLLFCCMLTFAQVKNTYFFKNDGRILSGPQDADYVMIITGQEGAPLYDVAEYYIDKTPKLIGKTSRPNYMTLEGKCETFYPSGKKQEMANFKNGNKEGDEYKYFPDGSLYTHKRYVNTINNPGGVFGTTFLVIECNDIDGKTLTSYGNGYFVGYDADFKIIKEEGPLKAGFKDGKWKGEGGTKDSKITFNEEYNNGQLIIGKSVDQNNNTYTYTVRDKQPQFIGGVEAFGSYLGQNIKYPYSARLNKLQGVVILTFVVQADGTLTEIKAVRSPGEDMAEEALRVLRLSPKWVPGSQYGRPVRVSYTVPVKFTL
jgi:TonB family protein